MAKIEITFPFDHPTSSGHFPGNPIIPGAVLLAEVVLAMEASLNRQLTPYKIKSAKFSHPVKPGDLFKIEIDATVQNEFKFQCMVGENIVLTGVVKCDNLPTT
ncbi:hypothetical protein [Sulfurirhabdus autotrophica]|uniref:FabA-like protein n=1 Tax=Sulfurirhabdus autotrophica TaxID=1706046 RepID=A0A4R3Y770_9PROT|nr:hypothetical protein [Sulfurirhabdus autotrophica]TCV87472.1 FabA-like protein [Sulfurirhabdus autotrophica]